MHIPLHPKTNRAPREVLKCIEPLATMVQEVMLPISKRWCSCHSVGDYKASLEARKKYGMSDRMSLIEYVVGLLVASTLYDRRMTPKVFVILKLARIHMNPWFFPQHTKLGRTHAGLENMLAGCHAFMTLNWILCNRHCKPAHSRGNTMHPTMAPLVWDACHNRMHRQDMCIQMALVLIHTIDPLPVTGQCALYIWVCNAFQCLGNTTFRRKHNSGQEVANRWREHIAFRNRSGLPGHTSEKYKLARRHPDPFPTVMPIYLDNEQDVRNLERDALRSIKLSANTPNKRAWLSHRGMAKQWTPTCRDNNRLRVSSDQRIHHVVPLVLAMTLIKDMPLSGDALALLAAAIMTFARRWEPSSINHKLVCARRWDLPRMHKVLWR